jgi:hypothetical protein
MVLYHALISPTLEFPNRPLCSEPHIHVLGIGFASEGLPLPLISMTPEQEVAPQFLQQQPAQPTMQ